MQPGSRLSKLVEAVPELRVQPEWVATEIAPWQVEGRLRVESLFQHLLFPFLDRCFRLGEQEVVTRLCNFLDRIVTNTTEERLVNQVRERASHIFAGIMPRVVYPRHPPLWVTDQPNLLDPTYVELVRAALATTTVVFGFHAYYYGGSSGDWWAVTNLSDYLHLVRSGRPGDLFWVHALEPLVRSGFSLAGAQWRSSQPLSSSLLGAEALSRIETYIHTGDSVVFVWWTEAISGGDRMCGVLESMEDFREEVDSQFARMEPSPGALFVLRYADLEKPETLLLKAKRPNESGEVPIGGAY